MPALGHDGDGLWPPMASPPKCTLPRTGASVPVSTFSSVLLPMPLRPSSASTSPGRMFRSMPNSTWLAP
jgi:hypothetical protein